MAGNDGPTMVQQQQCGDLSDNRLKRKARSTRRRLNAMVNNASLHFSDTDSEGELNSSRVVSVNGKVSPTNKKTTTRPKIFVTNDVDSNDLGSCQRSPNLAQHRGSIADNLTDVDELCSDPDANEVKYDNNLIIGGAAKCKKTNGLIYDTDCEDLAIDDDNQQIYAPIVMKEELNLLKELSGESVSTKEGDGPYSMEVKKKMIFGQELEAKAFKGKLGAHAEDCPDTENEDMIGSDDENNVYYTELPNLEVFANSETSLGGSNNVDCLSVSRPDLEDMSEGLTDVEDLE